MEQRLTLFRCSACDQFWQSGHEWNFGDEEYLFQVPSITAEEWSSEPYQQPASMMMYSAVMGDYYEKLGDDQGDSVCRADGCAEKVVRFCVFCQQHQVESLQNQGKLPQSPVGRIFPPYEITPKNLG